MEEIDFLKLMNIAIENDICYFSDSMGTIIRSMDYNLDYLLELYYNEKSISQECIEFVKNEFHNWLIINYKTIHAKNDKRYKNMRIQ